MKRAGNLIGRIAAPENIRLAFWKAAKGKWSRPATRAFASNLEPEIARLSAGLADGSFPFGAYRSFRVFDPKERWIHAAAFPERVAHHAIMNCCEPVFERAAVFDSYACRKGKGQERTLREPQQQQPDQRQQQQQRIPLGPSSTRPASAAGPRLTRPPPRPRREMRRGKEQTPARCW